MFALHLSELNQNAEVVRRTELVTQRNSLDVTFCVNALILANECVRKWATYASEHRKCERNQSSLC